MVDFCFVLPGAEILICDAMDQMPGIPTLLTKLVKITPLLVLGQYCTYTPHNILWFYFQEVRH